MKDLFSDLKKSIQGEVYFDKVTRQIYSTDASIYQIEPIGVVVPRHEDDLQKTIELARKYVVPILPRGGGTSLAGQCVGEALMIDFSAHMNNILELNTEENWVRVQPGVVQDQLNRTLATHGYLFGPDTSTSNRATIGGMAGNNSAGAHSLVYGKTVDHVIEIETFLADGSRVTFGPRDEAGFQSKMQGEEVEGHIHREVNRISAEYREEVDLKFPKILRRVSGYNLDEMVKSTHPNLASLLVGSEGTLAVSRILKLKMVPLPSHKGLLVAHFDNMIQAVEANEVFLAHGPSAAEMIDRPILEAALESPIFQGQTGFIEGSPGAIVIVEFYGESREEVVDKLEKLQAALKKEKMGYAYVPAIEDADQAQVWNLRKGGLGLLMGRRSEAKPVAFVEDTAVDPIKLPGFLEAFEKVVKEHGASAGYYGHCSVGLLHIRPFLNLKEPGERRKMMAIFNDIAALVEEYGGTMSGEHGDGLARSWLIERMFGSRLYEAFGDIKAAFDPTGILNPGKIVNPPDPSQNLRLGDFYQNVKLETALDFSREGGFNFAVEMCNGNGQCRKLDNGVMCPSFQATKDERQSTRGRANALRGFISGKLSRADLTSQDMFNVMDLCLECKACRTECPSKVDMAKMKYEFLYHYYKSKGTPMRARIFGNIDLINKIGVMGWPFTNLLIPSIINKFLQSWCGIAPQRKLPHFARTKFSRWFEKRKEKAARSKGKGTGKGAGNGDSDGNKRPRVILFNDSFVEYNHPEIGRDAVEVLERAGYEVALVDRKCCGRPLISKGMLDRAKENARYNVGILKGHAASGIPIVGIEPSCLLTLKEEYPDLIPGEDTDLVARMCITIDEFMVQLIKEGKLEFSGGAAPRDFLVHGHCHQKSYVGTSPTLEVLKSLPRANVKEIDAGCCGMAGTFGYEKEHYDISMAIGEQRLFPAIRESGEKVEIVADGFSCRQQIDQGVGRQARHLVQIVAEALRR